MSNLENLTQKILDDAKSSADEILQEAKHKKEGLVSTRIKEAERQAERLIERAMGEAITLKERAVSNAELKVRDEKLSAKRNVIERIFQLAKSRLMNIGENDYIDFLKNNIKELNLKGTEILIVPEKMRESVKNTGLALKISDTETVNSGFMIKDNNTILNFTFDSLVDYLREELESDIARSLFKE